MTGPDRRVRTPPPDPARAAGRTPEAARQPPDRAGRPTAAAATPVARVLGNQGVWRLRLSDPGSRAERAAEEVAHGAPGSGHGVLPGPELPPAVVEALVGTGDPMSAVLRDRLAPGSGPDAPDLAGVQLHTGPEAAELADALGARAFTIGSHIAFGTGQLEPGTEEGQRTLAHEADHVRRPDRALAGTGPRSVGLHRRLVLTGAAADLARVVAIMNHRLAPRHRARIGAGGVVEILETNVSGPLTAPNQAFTDRLRTILGETATTTVAVVAGGVPIVGSYDLATIDVADMEQLGLDQLGWDAGAALLHELVEQRQRQHAATAADRAFGSDTTGAHGVALAAEVGVIGARLESDTGLVASGAPGAGGLMSGTRTVVFRYPDGRRIEVVVTLVNNNITRVQRRRLP